MKQSKKYLIIAGIVLLCYTVVGFFVFPFAVKYFAEKTLREKVSPEATIDAVRANPFSLQLEVVGLNLPDPAGVWAVRFDRAKVNVSAMTFLKFYPVLDLIRLETPEIDYLRKSDAAVASVEEVSEDGEKTAMEADAPQSLEEWAEVLNSVDIPKLRISLLEVADGNLNFRDETNAVQFTESINPINFVLEDFTTVLDATGDNTMRFIAKTDAGTEIEWRGYLNSHPLTLEGSVRLSGVRIDQFSPYFERFLQFNLESAVYGMAFDYRIDFGTLDRLVQISEGTVDLNEVIFRPIDETDAFFSLETVALRGISVGYPSMDAEITSIHIKKGYTQAIRDESGTINLLNLVNLPDADEAVGAAPTAPSQEPVRKSLPTPQIQIHSFTVEDYRLSWLDRCLSVPAELEMTVDVLELKGLSSDLSEPVTAKLEMSLSESSRFDLNGEVIAATGQADLEIHLDSLPLGMANPYAESLAHARFDSGAFSFKGELSGDQKNGYTLTGSGALPALAFQMKGANPIEASWEQFEFTDVTTGNSPLRLKVDTVRLISPKAQFTRSATVSSEGTEGEKTEVKSTDGNAPTTEPAPSIDVQISNVQIDSGSLYVVDQVIQPSFRLSVENLQTVVQEISLSDAEPTTFKLSADINRSPFSMEGSLFPANPKAATKFEMELKELALPAFSPYSGQAIGRKLGTGWFSLKTTATVESGELDARNQIIIDQMALGDRVESPDAVKLPIGLAISLLKGPNGVMDLSLPLSGDLYDPSVGLGQIIRTAVVGLITNVASAPFKMLSGLVGADEDISKVSFAVGSAEVIPETGKTLDVLSAALNKRPELTVGIVPSVSEDDLIVLASRTLRDNLLADSEVKDDKTFEKYLKKAYKAFEKANEPLPYELPESATDAETIAFMKAVLLPELLPTSEIAQELLEARVSAVREYLTTVNAITPERVVDGAPDLSKDRAVVSFELE